AAPTTAVTPTAPATTTTSVVSTTEAPPPATPTTTPPVFVSPSGPGDPAFAATRRAFTALTANTGASLTVAQAGEIVVSMASGTTVGGIPATGDSPLLVASVSKIVVATAIARLADQGSIDVSDAVPWADIGISPHPAWGNVTIRELLDHRGGLPTARSSWFTGESDCRTHVSSLVQNPPTADRGRWVYSNGNYCVLGLVVEHRTGAALDAGLQQLLFDPIGRQGVHLTDGGLREGDLPHDDRVERLSRLGGAGNLVISTDDLATLFARLTDADRTVLRPPAVFTDQYGIGHTGTITAAKACVWLFDGGATVVAAAIAGDSVSTGGAVCDLIVPAVAADLGRSAGEPDRTP
ncbi:MAG: serine hydrolase domain-containing protein, partial [Ilumatobacter sp.]